jgi:endonuclease YncB( thermonuclease family)
MPNAARREDLASLADYPVLLARVRETFVLGQQKAEELKVQTYWEAGRLIHEHLRHHQDQAGYGKQLMLKLARGLGVGDELLYRMLRFYEAFPISSGRRKLTWTHYRTLARLPDKKKRLEIEAIATRENWNAEKLEKHISFLTAGATNATLSQDEANGGRPQGPRRVQLLEPKRGTTGIYRIVADGDGLAVDLGFTSYQALNSRSSRRKEAQTSESAIRNRKSEIDQSLVTSAATNIKPGDLVTLARHGQPVSAPDATTADLYTYAAEILRVVDGDTLWLKIWLKAGHWLKEKVRLRGLDSPEISTPEGKAAKQFVEGLLRESVSVTITTTKPDKWDRYLSDIFLTMPSPLRGEGGHRPDEVEELFLNNELLKCGHARRYDKVTPADWEE